MWGVFVDVDGHKRGQTSRSFVGSEIQANSNFKAHVYQLTVTFWILSVAAGSISISHTRIPVGIVL